MHCGRVAKSGLFSSIFTHSDPKNSKITHSKKKTNISQETLQEEKIKGTYSLYSNLR